MLTLQDLLKIENIVDKKLEEKFEEKLKFLPSKEDFYTMVDKIMGELQSTRESIELLTQQHAETNDQLENHDKRIKKIEQHLHPSPLPAA